MSRIELNCNRVTATEGSLEAFTVAKRVLGFPAVVCSAEVSVTRYEAAARYCLAKNLAKFEAVCKRS